MSAHELHSERVRAAEAARELSEVIGRMVSLLRFESSDVYEICRSAFDGAKILNYSEFTSISQGDFPVLWQNACLSLKVDDETRRIFSLAGSVLGCFDLQSQTERLMQLQEELHTHAESLKKKAENERKLYVTLGAAFGITVSIIII